MCVWIGAGLGAGVVGSANRAGNGGDQGCGWGGGWCSTGQSHLIVLEKSSGPLPSQRAAQPPPGAGINRVLVEKNNPLPGSGNVCSLLVSWSPLHPPGAP